jgi:uncharacterized damage-inducible protein DinB
MKGSGMDLNDRLLGHDRDMTFHLLSLCHDLTDEQWDREFDIGHRTLRETFSHMISSTNFWEGCMTGAPEDMEFEDKTLHDLERDHRAVYQRFETFARSVIADGRLDDHFEDVWQVQRSFGATILHVILHNHLHRNDALHILQRLGKENLPEGDPLEWEGQLRADRPLSPA